MKELLSQCDLRFTPALHFVSSPVKLLSSKTHQEMDFLQPDQIGSRRIPQDDFTFTPLQSLSLKCGPPQMNRHSFNQIDGQWLPP